MKLIYGCFGIAVFILCITPHTFAEESSSAFRVGSSQACMAITFHEKGISEDSSKMRSYYYAVKNGQPALMEMPDI